MGHPRTIAEFCNCPGRSDECTRCKCPDCTRLEGTLIAGMGHLLVNSDEVKLACQAMPIGFQALANAMGEQRKELAAAIEQLNHNTRVIQKLLGLIESHDPPPIPAPPKGQA